MFNWHYLGLLLLVASVINFVTVEHCAKEEENLMSYEGNILKTFP